MKQGKRELLFARILPPRSRSGISLQDIAQIPICSELVTEIIDCLQSSDDLDIGFGLYFAEVLRSRSEFRSIAEPSFPLLAALISGCLTHTNSQVRVAALRAFVAFRGSYDGYSDVMHQFLRHPDKMVRRSALGAAPTFLLAGELGELLKFERDPEFNETGGMGGPMRYDIRDFALEIAESIAGQKFDCGDCFEQKVGLKISWRSWAAFRRWLEVKKKWKLFGS